MIDTVGKYMSNNVILFPKKNNKVNDMISVEKIDRNVELMKHYHIQETIANIAPLIFNNLDIAGFPLSEDEEIDDIKDGAFVIESLRSLMCKYHGLHHPFQNLAEGVFIKEKGDEDSLKIVDTINIKLKLSDDNQEGDL
jgi:hypothetical protein